MKKLLSIFTAILFTATMFACPISATAATSGDQMTQSDTGAKKTTKKAKKSKKKTTKKAKKGKKKAAPKKTETAA